jgi:hypothetical protein
MLKVELVYSREDRLDAKGWKMGLNHPESSLVAVHVCYSDAEADIVIAFLKANEIDAVSTSKVDHSVFPITADGLAEVHVLVTEESAEAARSLLAQCKLQESAGEDEGDRE